jgi:hypothetical protein
MANWMGTAGAPNAAIAPQLNDFRTKFTNNTPQGIVDGGISLLQTLQRGDVTADPATTFSMLSKLFGDAAMGPSYANTAANGVFNLFQDGMITAGEGGFGMSSGGQTNGGGYNMPPAQPQGNPSWGTPPPWNGGGSSQQAGWGTDNNARLNNAIGQLSSMPGVDQGFSSYLRNNTSQIASNPMDFALRLLGDVIPDGKIGGQFATV